MRDRPQDPGDPAGQVDAAWVVEPSLSGITGRPSVQPRSKKNSWSVSGDASSASVWLRGLSSIVPLNCNHHSSPTGLMGSSISGSIRTGARVMELAAGNITKVSLELGNNSPVIIEPDGRDEWIERTPLDYAAPVVERIGRWNTDDARGGLWVMHEGDNRLVMDELGSQKPTQFVQDMLYYIINTRYNEELTTINQELQSTIEEQRRTNADLENLIVSTEIGTVFLDKELRIRRFTPSVTALFNFVPTDPGRPLAHITHRLGYPALIDEPFSLIGYPLASVLAEGGLDDAVLVKDNHIAAAGSIRSALLSVPLKGGQFIFSYYPDDAWKTRSALINCGG